MILDNAKIHHIKLLTRFLQENPRLYLPFVFPQKGQHVIIALAFLWQNHEESFEGKYTNRRKAESYEPINISIVAQET